MPRYGANANANVSASASARVSDENGGRERNHRENDRGYALWFACGVHYENRCGDGLRSTLSAFQLYSWFGGGKRTMG